MEVGCRRKKRGWAGEEKRGKGDWGGRKGGRAGEEERREGGGVEGKRMLLVMMECVKDKKGKGNHGEVKKKEGANIRQVRDRDDLEVRNDSRRASRWDSTL